MPFKQRAETFLETKLREINEQLPLVYDDDEQEDLYRFLLKVKERILEELSDD